MQDTAPETAEETFWSPSGVIPRATFNTRLALLLGAILGSIAWAGGGSSLGAGTVLLGALVLVLVQATKRARDGLGSGWWAVGVAIPGLGLLMLVALAVVPSKREGP